MGRLIVDYVSARDFLSYHSEQAIHLGGRGPVAVVGTNGAGKSTIVSKAMAWCLFGTCAPERMGASTKAMRGKDVLRKKLEPAHKATPDPETCHVSVGLRDADTNTCYEITRWRKRVGKDKIAIRVRDDTTGYDAVEGETQDEIDQLIGADYAVFVRTCLRGQNDPWNFAEATDAKKREILDGISGAAMLDEPHKRAKKALSEAKNDALTFRTRAEDAERRANSIELDRLRRQSEEWEQGRVSRVRAAQSELDALHVSHEEARKTDEAMAGNDARRNAIKAEEPSMDFAPYRKAMKDAQEAERATRASLDLATATKGEAERLLAKGQCPACGQAITAASPCHRAAHIDLETLAGPYRAAVEHRIACEQSQAQAQDWLNSAHREWRAKLDAIPQPGAAQAPAAEAAVTMARKRLTEITGAENPYHHALEQAQLQRFDLLREAAVFREQQVEAERKVRMANAWIGVLAPKGVRAHMAEGALAAIEAEANKWLSILSDGRLSVAFPPTQTTVKTKAVREEIKTVIRTHDTELPFLAYSGGEKTRINLAVDLGVAATFAKGGALAVSLLVLDEQVFSGLDPAGQISVVTALHHAGVADVVVIDHDPKLSGALPRTVRATIGPDGYSRVEEIS